MVGVDGFGEIGGRRSCMTGKLFAGCGRLCGWERASVCLPNEKTENYVLLVADS